jgi:3-phosphoshikimate 1-carboxyvinyltransferase
MMGEGRSKIANYLYSPDTFDMIDAMEQFGTFVERSENDIFVEGLCGKLGYADDVISVGNSGLVFRFFTALSALSSSYTVVTGDNSIRHIRPIQHLLEALRSRGVFAESTRGDGYAPILIRGPIEPGIMVIDGRDSQPVSALLVLTAFLEGTSEIYVTGPGEKPWIDMTLDWLKRLDIKVKNEGYRHYVVHGKAHYLGFEYTVPGDFSTAAFPIIAALITHSAIKIEGLDMDDVQGDKEIIPLLIKHGANIEYDKEKKTLSVHESYHFIGGTIDVNGMIDAIPILAVFGCFTKEPLELRGASIAREKESNRLLAIKEELSKMGAKIEEIEDGLIVYPSILKSAVVESHYDHRIALSLMVAGLATEGKTIVKGVECIAKTYPTFLRDFVSLQARIT